MITDDEARKMYVCAPLLGEPASEVVRSLVDELLAARKVVAVAREVVAYWGSTWYIARLSDVLAEHDKAVKRG